MDTPVLGDKQNLDTHYLNEDTGYSLEDQP